MMFLIWIPRDPGELAEQPLHPGLIAFGADAAGAGDLPLGRRRIAWIVFARDLKLVCRARQRRGFPAEHP
jgi:hypothetical protein